MIKLSKLTSIVLLAGTLVLTAGAARAQDMVDAGNSPSHPAYIHFGVGYYYQLKGDQDRAIEEFTQAIELLPDWGNPYAARGDSLVAIGEFELAIVDYNMAIEIYPDFVSALYTRGRAYHEIGEIDLAIADYENAIGQWPEYALPYWGLGDIYFEQSDLVPALDNYEAYLGYVGLYPNEDEIASIEVLARTQQLREGLPTSLT